MRGKKWEEQSPYGSRWLLRLTTVLFVYCFINFGSSWCAFRTVRRTRTTRAGFELTSHGHFIRAISEEEYHRYRGWEIRGFSGHWMVFYSASLMMLTSAYRERHMPAVPKIVLWLLMCATL